MTPAPERIPVIRASVTVQSARPKRCARAHRTGTRRVRGDRAPANGRTLLSHGPAASVLAAFADASVGTVEDGWRSAGAPSTSQSRSATVDRAALAATPGRLDRRRDRTRTRVWHRRASDDTFCLELMLDQQRGRPHRPGLRLGLTRDRRRRSASLPCSGSISTGRRRGRSHERSRERCAVEVRQLDVGAQALPQAVAGGRRTSPLR